MLQPLITVQTPRDSTILAYGTAPAPGKRRLLVTLGVLVALIFVFGSLWLAVRPRLPVGATAILITTRPAVTTRLSAEARSHLPAAWRQALEGTSLWPVLLGGGLGPNGWEWFAVTPRWRSAKGLPSVTAGLSRIVYDQEPVHASSYVTYGSALADWLRSPRQEAVGTLALQAVSVSSSRTHFWYRRGVILTSLRFAQPPSTFTPRNSDVSVNISALDTAAKSELLNELPIPSFVRFDSLREVHLRFRAQGLPEEVQLVHQHPLSRAQAGQVLAGFGVTVKRLIQLADGSVATELATPTEDLSQPITLEGRDRLWIKDTEIRYGSSTEALAPVTSACHLRFPVARFSARALQKLFMGIGLPFGEANTGNWQIGAAQNGMMILCKE